MPESVAHILVVISVCISFVGSYTYIRDTLQGKTKPNKMSWTLWALAPISGAYIAVDAGADMWGSARVFYAGIGPLLILCASFWNPHSYWKLGWFDYVCGAASLMAFYLWLGAESPRLAIVLLALADVFAAVPVFVKAWSFPETESGTIYIVSCCMTIITLPAIPVWNIENSAFQLYLLVVNTLLALAVYRKKISLYVLIWLGSIKHFRNN